MTMTVEQGHGQIDPEPVVLQSSTRSDTVIASYPQNPLDDDPQFIENLGQLGIAGGFFYLPGRPLSFAFHDDHVMVVVRSLDGAGEPTAAAYEIRFVGSEGVIPRGMEPTGKRYGFIKGHDPSRWVSGAVGYMGLQYLDLWGGVDIRYYPTGGTLKYEFIVRPGGDVDSIRLGFDGVDDIAVSEEGDLIVRTAMGFIRDEPPIAYQAGPEDRVPVRCAFMKLDDRTIGIDVDSYDRSRPLIIDPRLLFVSYLGTTVDDWALDGTVNSAGSIYVMGVTESVDFPTTTGALDLLGNGGFDLFICKLAPNGADLQYCTYIGGSGNDNGYYSSISQAQTYGGLCIDGDGAVYVAGHTNSSDLPTTSNAYMTANGGGYDVFVLKLVPTLDTLEYCTYVGGPSDDYAMGISVDAQGNAFVVGSTSGSFPTTTGAYDETYNGGGDALIFKLDSTGGILLGATYLGGSGNDWGNAITVDGSGRPIIAGTTESDGFPTKGAYDATHNGLRDMVITRLSADLSVIGFSTFIGTSGQDYANDILIDFLDRVYITGYTTSTAFPTTLGCYNRDASGGIDVIVLRLDATGTSIDASTYFGGAFDDRAFSIVQDSNNDILVTGSTMGNVPTTTNAHSRTNSGDSDIFVLKIDGLLRTLKYSSLIGGSGDDKAWAIRASGAGDMYVIGQTVSDDLPTTAISFDGDYSGGMDGFVLMIGEPKTPVWGPLPLLQAVEDIPMVYNFSQNVTDADTPLTGLSITSTSPYFQRSDGLEVTFTFPNGVLTMSVSLVLTDDWNTVPGTVSFEIAPVNDPPSCNLVGSYHAIEDEPLNINFTGHVSDVDNSIDDLRLLTDCPYAIVVGLTITITIPDGVVEYRLWVNVTDGLLSIEVMVTVVIDPIDDPPEVGPLPTFEVIEDTESSFDLAPYITDIDTPLDEVHVTVTNPNVTVRGMSLYCLLQRGDIFFSIVVEVSDAHSTIRQMLQVHVAEVNDPPRVQGIPPQLLIEGEPGAIDVSPFVFDEESPREMLTLACSDSHVVSIEGLTLALYYYTWMVDQIVMFTVSDGLASTNGSFELQLLAVNDAPIVLSIGNSTFPYSFTLDEGTDTYYLIEVQDEDSVRFKYSMASKWPGISVLQNGTIHILTLIGDFGEYTAILSVDDMGGQNVTVPIQVKVENVNDPPRGLLIIEPFNHTSVEVGNNVTFSVDVTDADMVLGQVLTVTWISNISGVIKILTTMQRLQFTTSVLPIGVHRITVNVTDGEFSLEAWFEIFVHPVSIPPKPQPNDSALQSPIVIIASLSISVVLIVVIVAFITSVSARKRADEEDRTEIGSPLVGAGATSSSTVKGPISMEGDLARLSRNLGEMATQLEAQRAAEASAIGETTSVVPRLDSVQIATPLSAKEEADRERTREIRAVMNALTQLPQGLPTSLWGWDMSELARTIVDGEKRSTHSGIPLIRIKDVWYNADRSNVGRFLREWKEPETTTKDKAGKTTAGENTRRLELLEVALLEGKISEQTYKDLKAKYEK